MLDGTPPQEKLYMHLHVLNACEQSCIMMIMGGSQVKSKSSQRFLLQQNKMFKTEYDLKAIMYPAYDTPHKLCNIRGNENIQHPRIPPNNAWRPMCQFKCPLLGSSRAQGHPCISNMIMKSHENIFYITNMIMKSHESLFCNTNIIMKSPESLFCITNMKMKSHESLFCITNMILKSHEGLFCIANMIMKSR